MPPGGLLPGSVGGQSPAPTRAATGWTAEADDLLELLPVDAPSNNSTAVVELGGESFEHVLFVDNDQDQPRPAPTAAVHVQDQGNPRQPNILSRVASYLLPKENSSRGGTDAKLWSPRLERVTDQLRVSMDGPSSSGNLLKNMPRGPGTSKLRPMHSTGRSTEGGITGHLYAKSMGRSFSALRSWIPNREAQHPPTLVRKGTFMTRLQNQLQDIAGPPSALQRLEMDGPAVEIVVESSGRLSRASQFFESYPAASFVIHPLSKLRYYWDVTLVLIVVISLIVWPFRTAYYWSAMDMEFQSQQISKGWAFLGYSMDIFFLLDVAFNFNCGFVRQHDYVAVMNRKAIALNYIWGWFWLDLLTSAPTHILQCMVRSLRAVHVLRITNLLIGVLRLNRAFRSATQVQLRIRVSRFTIRISKWVVFAFLLLHWNSCVQFLVAAATEFPEGCWVELTGLTGEAVWKQYVWSIYMASSQMLGLGYGPVDPFIDQEVVVVLASFVLSTCLFPILISIITTSLISMDSLREEFQRKVEAWDQYMAHRRLPLDLRDKIRLAMDYRWRTRRAIDEDKMMHDLPESLQMDIKLHMYEGMLLQVPEFRNPPEGFIHSLVPFLRPEIYMQGDYIFHESTTGREMYFIHTGQVEVLQNGHRIQMLNRGTYFGEVAIMKEVVRSASCKAATNCEVSILRKKDLDEVLKDFPCVKSNLEDAVHTKVLEDLKRIKSRMSDCAVLVASGALQDEQEVDEVQEMTGIDRFAVSSTGPSFVLGRNR